MTRYFAIVLGSVVILFACVFLGLFAVNEGIGNILNQAGNQIAAFAGNGDDDPQVITPTPPADSSSDDNDDQPTEIVLLGEGQYINGFQDAASCYNISRNDLDEWLSQTNSRILFEGELCDALSIHQVMLVNEPLNINQGTFWLYETGAGDLAEDVLMAFAHDKWENWRSQNITSLPIIVHMPDGDQRRFGRGVEPTLTEGQQELVEQNEADRCPSGDNPIEETPFSDSEGDNQVEGAPGSSICLTIYVPAEETAAIGYFLGAWDNFPYPARGAEFYLAPKDWTEEDVQVWAGNRNVVKLR